MSAWCNVTQSKQSLHLSFYNRPSCFLNFTDSFFATSSCDCSRYFFHSAFFRLLISSVHTHLYFATYGAGLNPGRLHISSNSSSVTLKEAVVGDSLSPTTQNIFCPTENTRSFSHLMSSVTAGSSLQICCMSSIVIF